MLPTEGRVLVQGVKMVKRHQTQVPGNPQGGIVEQGSLDRRLATSPHVDPARTARPTRVGFKFLEDGRKVRFAKRSGELIDR